jgi:hypothetical protein
MKIIPLMLAMLAIVILSVAAQSTTLIYPTSGITLPANFRANMSISNIPDGNSSGCELFGYSVSTANSSAVSWGINNTITATNGTNKRTLNITLNPEIIEDAADWVFYANCSDINGTMFKSADASGITVDLSTPNTPVAILPVANVRYTAYNTIINYTINGSETTICTLYIGNTLTTTMTESGDTCYYTLARRTIPDYTYGFYMTATDGTQTTTSATTQATIDYESEGGNANQQQIQVGVNEAVAKKSTDTMYYFLGAVVVLIGYLMLKKKK